MQKVFLLFFVFIFMLAVGANVGVYAMLPLYLQAGRGLDQTTANTLLSMSRMAAILTPFLVGWVTDRFDYWPFVIPALLVTLPLLWFLLRRQLRTNTMPMMLYAYVILLFAFFYVSRFLQPNYLGFMLGFLALALTLDEKGRPVTEPQ